MKIKKIFMPTVCLALLLSLFACAPGSIKYDNYRKDVDKLYERIIATDAIINNIDVNSETSVTEMFDALDKLKEEFETFSKVDTPKEFKDCQYLSEEAAKYVDSAEQNFHLALDGEYNDTYFKNGVANYNEVLKCVNYMGDVLQKK